MTQGGEPKGGKRRPPPLPPVTTLTNDHRRWFRQAFSRAISGLSAPDVEDLVQWAMLEAHKSRGSRLEPRALLRGIVRHRVARYYEKRAQQEEAARAADEVFDDGEEASATLDEDAQKEQRRRAIVGAIELLPEMFRDVLIACVLDGESMPSYAARLQIEPNTGHTRLHLARKHLPECLARYLARNHIKPEDL